MTRQRSGAFRALLLSACVLLVGGSASGEEATVEALSVYQSQGKLSKTGPSSATFAGTLSGLFFVMTSEGPGRPASIVCPGSLEVDLETGAQEGKGKCTIENRDGDEVYADWTCDGYHLVGCRGDFVLTGGLGRFEGVTGGGKMTVRSDVHEMAVQSKGTVSRASQGVIWWQDLHYQVP